MKTIIRPTLADLKAIDPFQLDFGDYGIVTADTDTDLIGLYRLAYNVSSAKKSDDNNWVRASLPNRVYLPADVANSGNDALADVTALSFPVLSGKKYKFRAFIVYSSAATTTGSRWTVNIADAPTTLFYQSQYSLTTTTVTINTGLGAVQLPAAANATSAATTGNIATMEGILVPSANGTLIVQSASEVNASAVTAKANISYIEWEEI